MPYTAHHRVTLEGYLGSPGQAFEIFTTGFALTATLAQSPPSWENAVGTRTMNFWGGGGAGAGATAVLTRVKISLKDATGHDVAPPVIFLTPGVGTPGGGNGGFGPMQTARVISLNGKTAPKRQKGRLYIPAPSENVDNSTGRFKDATEQAKATAWAAYFAGVQQDSGETVVVASGIDGNHPVTMVRVGDIPGIIRKRRNGLLEQYKVANV